MPLDFPTSPSVGQIYQLDNRSWQWNGAAWKLLATSSINNTPIGNSAANTGSFTTVAASSTLTANGNITTQGYFLGDGGLLSNIFIAEISNGTSNVKVVSSNSNIAVSVAGNSNVAVFGSGQSSIRGNLVPDASNTYSLGTSALRWSNLWVSGNTIVLGNVVLKDNNGVSLGVYAADGVTVANLMGTVINTTAFGYNSPNIAASGNISNTYNALSSGPITINNGVTVTVDNNAVWTIV